MMCSHTPIDSEAENFYEIYSTEVAEKKKDLYFSFLQQLLVRIQQIGTVFMHVAAADCAVF